MTKNKKRPRHAHVTFVALPVEGDLRSSYYVGIFQASKLSVYSTAELLPCLSGLHNVHVHMQCT